jgi:type II secretory pathway pseudopilin PulG
LEAVLALAIIGLAAVAILGATAGQVRSADKAGVLLLARALGDDRMASFRILGYEDLRNPPDSLASGTFPTPFEEFSWVATVEPVEEEHDLFSLDVVIAGRGESLPLSTLLHRPRPQILVRGDP